MCTRSPCLNQMKIGIVASRVSVELHILFIFFDSGDSYGPQLEDVDTTVPRLLVAPYVCYMYTR